MDKVVQFTVRCSVKVVDGILKAIDMVGTLSGEDIEVDLTLPEPPKPKRGREATVQYSTVTSDAKVFEETLDAIGKDTMQGLVYKHLWENGPCTERQIRESSTWTRKSVESSLDKLKSKGVIVPQPIAEGQTGETK